MPKNPPIIFTDLDGTLLAHEDYRHDAVTRFLPDISDVPVVLATSKTRPEVVRWQQRLGLDGPFMVENGSAIYLPANMNATEIVINGAIYAPISSGDFSYYELGTRIEMLLPILKPYESDIVNFVTCPIDEAMSLTGLDQSDAEDARDRHFSVPILVPDNAVSAAIALSARTNGYQCHQGGRFLHLQGACSKGLALKVIQTLIENHHQITYHAIAIGDSENDRDMLNAADTAIIVSNPEGTTLELDHRDVIRTTQRAPEGWVEGVRQALGIGDLDG